MNDLTKLKENSLKKLSACYISSALFGNPGHIPAKRVVPQELSSRRFWFRIGRMYFDLILNDDGSTSLYSVSEDGGSSLLIG